MERFQPSPGSVPRARMLVRSLHDDLPAGTQGAVEQIVSELSANAVEHARTMFVVSISVAAIVRVEVADQSREPPRPQQPSPTSRSGRGLKLVDAFANRWGWEPTADGKVVWAEVDGGSWPGSPP